MKGEFFNEQSHDFAVKNPSKKHSFVSFHGGIYKKKQMLNFFFVSTVCVLKNY